MRSKTWLCASQSAKFAGDSGNVVSPGNVAGGGVCQIRMMRSASANGSGRRTTALTSVKIAELAPMPRPRMTIAAVVNPGVRMSDRMP